MEFNIKKVKTDAFYATILEWCEGQNFPPLMRGLLPEYTFVCYNEDTPVYCVSYYKTDSMFAWLGWELGNPNIHPKEKKGGLAYLLKHIAEPIKEDGFRCLITTTGTKPVEQALKQANFTLGDKNIDQYLKII